MSVPRQNLDFKYSSAIFFSVHSSFRFDKRVFHIVVVGYIVTVAVKLFSVVNSMQSVVNSMQSVVNSIQILYDCKCKFDHIYINKLWQGKKCKTQKVTQLWSSNTCMKICLDICSTVPVDFWVNSLMFQLKIQIFGVKLCHHHVNCFCFHLNLKKK